MPRQILARNTPLPYRPDVDGLRALAVLCVILYHFEVPLFKGGFVGVDVFFVISGFLITRLITFELENNTFSYSTFYSRRVRRLFPALLVTVAFTVFVFSFLYFPSEFGELKKSAQAAILGVSNIYFWNTFSYFGYETVIKPLLHTWSLGVEEQFYLIWPLVVGLLFKISTKARIVVSLLAITVSVIISEYLLKSHASLVFYWMPFRSFEFLFGALLIFAKIELKKYQQEVLATFGLVGIFGSVFFLNSDTSSFPGVNALWSVVGTCLIILSPQSFLNRALSLRPLVACGRASYSLYLVHWPVFLFFIAVGVDFAHSQDWLKLVLATAGLGWALHLGIEQPVRSSGLTARQIWAIWPAATVASIAVLQAPINRFNRQASGEHRAYLEWREQARQAYLKEAQYGVCWIGSNETIETFKANGCLNVKGDKPAVLVVGDSHAAHLLVGLKRNFPDHEFKLLATDTCPIVDDKPISERLTCRSIREFVLNGLEPSRFAYVIFSYRTLGDLNSTEQMLERLNRVQSRTQAKTFLIGPIQNYRRPMYLTRFLRPPSEKLPDIFFNLLDPERFSIDAKLGEQFLGSAVEYISSIRQLCPTGPSSCLHFGPSGYEILLDHSHFTPESSIEFVRMLKERKLLVLSSTKKVIR